VRPTEKLRSWSYETPVLPAKGQRRADVADRVSSSH